MDITKKLSDIINILDVAVSESDWDSVVECIEELNYLNDEIQSSFPYETGEFDSESDF